MTTNKFLRELQGVKKRQKRESEQQRLRLQRQLKEMERRKARRQAELEVAAHENQLELLTSAHQERSEAIAWLQARDAEAPVKPAKQHGHQEAAGQALEDYKPSLIDKVLNRSESRRTELLAAVQDGRQADEYEHKAALQAYEQSHADWESTRKLASAILNGDVSAYQEAVVSTSTFNEITEWGYSVEFRPVDSSTAAVTLHMKGDEVVPAESKSLLKTGKVSVKEMPTTRHHELYRDHVCSCVLRIAAELFSLLPLVDMAIITAATDLLDSKTGHMREQAILSVAVPRQTLSRLNLEQLDPSDSMSNFVHNTRFVKTRGFAPVEPVDPSEPGAGQVGV